VVATVMKRSLISAKYDTRSKNFQNFSVIGPDGFHFSQLSPSTTNRTLLQQES
jgi:transcriptional regulator of heat shock response